MRFSEWYVGFVIITSLYRLWVSTRIPGVEKVEGKVKAPATFWGLTIGYVVIVAASATEYFTLRRDSVHFGMAALGLAVYLFGILAREWPLRTLNRFWSHHIEIREDHQLILDGPYHYLRHPNYLCLLCEIMGFPLVSNSYFSFGLALLIYIPLLRARIQQEEAALLEKFGELYAAYKRHVPGLIPIPGRTAAALKAQLKTCRKEAGKSAEVVP